MCWPICRAYSRRHVQDEPADAFFRLLCRIAFSLEHRSWPRLVKPRRFTEKLWARMLNERDPLLTVISDKFLARDIVREKAGAEVLIPLLWEGTD